MRITTLAVELEARLREPAFQQLVIRENEPNRGLRLPQAI